MVALDLNLPFKQAGLVPGRLPVILGKLINKTQTTHNWHTEHGSSTEAKQKEKTPHNWSISTWIPQISTQA